MPWYSFSQTIIVLCSCGRRSHWEITKYRRKRTLLGEILGSFYLVGSFSRVISKNFFLMVKKGKKREQRKNKEKEKQANRVLFFSCEFFFKSELANEKWTRDMVTTAKKLPQFFSKYFKEKHNFLQSTASHQDVCMYDKVSVYAWVYKIWLHVP